MMAKDKTYYFVGSRKKYPNLEKYQIPKSKSAKRVVLDILVEAIINYFCKDKPITCLKSGI